MTNIDILKDARLEVSSEAIRLFEETDPSKHISDVLGAYQLQFQKYVSPITQGVESEPEISFDEFFREFSEVLLGGVRGSEVTSFRGGFSHKSSHKSQHKSRHKSQHKSLHKSLAATKGVVDIVGLDWPVIEVPWRALGRLYKRRETFHWDGLPLDLPPPVQTRVEETRALRELQTKLRLPENAFRRERIVQEATNDLTAYMLPLGADVTSPASATAALFQTIIWLGNLIGQIYKARFEVPRPHALDPSLEPYIPVPAYSSYPSNHAFQSLLIAEVFARAVPEHPGVKALFAAAREVAINREWAGLHVRSDTIAGEELAAMCTPLFVEVLEQEISVVRKEWLGEGLRG